MRNCKIRAAYPLPASNTSGHLIQGYRGDLCALRHRPSMSATTRHRPRPKRRKEGRLWWLEGVENGGRVGTRTRVAGRAGNTGEREIDKCHRATRSLSLLSLQFFSTPFPCHPCCGLEIGRKWTPWPLTHDLASSLAQIFVRPSPGSLHVKYANHNGGLDTTTFCSFNQTVSPCHGQIPEDGCFSFYEC